MICLLPQTPTDTENCQLFLVLVGFDPDKQRMSNVFHLLQKKENKKRPQSSGLQFEQAGPSLATTIGSGNSSLSEAVAT